MRRATLATAILGLALLTLAACRSGTAQPGSRSGSTGSAAPSQTAAPSGELSVYAALTQENGDALAKAFSAVFPSVHVNMITGGTGALVTRISSEEKAGGTKADVIFLADPTAMDALSSSGLLSDYLPAAASDLPAGLKAKNWAGVLTFQNVIASRKGISDPPGDWTDLTKPGLKGKVVLADPSYSGTTFGEVRALSSRLGWTYFQNLKGNGAKVEQSTNTVGTDIAQGMDDAGITLDSVVRDLVKKGAPVAIVWPSSGSVAVPAPVAISTHSKNPAASKAFFDWLFSPAGQKQIVTLGYVPAVPGTQAGDLIPSGTKQISVDWADLGGRKDAILKQFHDIFGG